MKKVLIPLSILLMGIAGCARKTVPAVSRVEQLKAERQAALNNENTAKNTKSKKHKNKETASVAENNAVANIVHFDSSKYVDSAFANYTYETLAQAYADTIAQNPNLNDPTLNYTKDFFGAVNFNMRKPNFVIIHHTSQNSVDETLHTFMLERTQVSAHYLIGRDGSIHHLVNDYLRAWQAGSGKWGNITDMNSCSVGIELDNDGYGPFSDAQINSLVAVLTSLKKRFGIPQANFIGHADFAPTRKNDPNVNFPWKALSDKGFGLWWSDTTNVQVPQDFNEFQALRIIGYDVRDVTKAVIAFRRHFCSVESAAKMLSPGERKVLYCLYSKYMY
ncbi:MAG TPA: N-acetylmuramoyl-L-alanine amidase [Arachidicoccus sp.]